MATKDTTGKTAYMYDSNTDKWYAVAGMVNTSAAYTWTGTQNFNNTVLANDVLIAKAGVNNFINPAARDAAIPSPTAGLVCFVRNDSTGATYNKLEYYTGTTWLSVGRFSVKSVTLTSGTYTLLADDDSKMLKIPSTATIYIPTNSQLALPIGYRVELFQSSADKFTAGPTAGGLSIYSKVSTTVNQALRSSVQYGTVVLTKIDTNSWLIAGDLEEVPVSPTPAPVSAPVPAPTPTPVTPTSPVPAPAPVAAPTLGVWYTYCGNVSAGYPPGTVVGPTFSEGGNCSSLESTLTSLGEIGSGWNCATGYSNSATVSAATCSSPTPAPTPAPASLTTYYGCCSNGSGAQGSYANSSLAATGLQSQCANEEPGNNLVGGVFTTPQSCSPSPTPVSPVPAPAPTPSPAAPSPTPAPACPSNPSCGNDPCGDCVYSGATCVGC